MNLDRVIKIQHPSDHNHSPDDSQRDKRYCPNRSPEPFLSQDLIFFFPRDPLLLIRIEDPIQVTFIEPVVAESVQDIESFDDWDTHDKQDSF